MDIGHNKIEKLKENLLKNGQIRATVFNFTRPNFELRSGQTPNFFGQKYIEHVKPSITKLLEPSSEK